MGHTDSVNRATPVTRREQKERTRIALLDAALRLLEGKSFGSLGLREVAREAGVDEATLDEALDYRKMAKPNVE